MNKTLWRPVDKRKAAVLLILERNELAVDLKMKIIKEIFPPPSSETVDAYLADKGLPVFGQPDIWNWHDLMKYGGRMEDAFGLQWHDRSWLRKACHLLGMEYSDLGEGYRSDRRAVAISFPDNWVFDPDREVSCFEICVSCDKELEEGENMYHCRLGIACGSCIRPRIPRRSDEEEDEDEEGYSDKYPWTLSRGSPERSDGHRSYSDVDSSELGECSEEEDSQADTDEYDKSE